MHVDPFSEAPVYINTFRLWKKAKASDDVE